MLVPPVAQGGTGGRPVADSRARGQQSSAPAGTLWPLAPAQPSQPSNQQSQATPPLAATPAPAHNQGVSRYGLYSLFPGGGGGNYVAATPATPGPTPARAYHATTHKVSESVFSAAVGVGVGGYTWGAPTPPPGSPYSPVPVTQLELLAKNLASLAPPAQQALSLQGVGVNVGSLHHAQHTQHTQHTLNLAGLHHLHHGGLHQSTFSPQLSLVTGNAPTLTINSFSSSNSTGNVAPTTGVLLQEYQSPTASSATCPASSSSQASLGPCATSTVSTMVVQGGTSVQASTKKREAFLSSQGQPVKLENKARQPCVCRNGSGKTKVVHSDAGCSRTLPVASSWNGQDSIGIINNIGTSLVKREPLASVPCQVAEVSTSLHATTTAVKIEPVAPKSENGIVVSNAGAAGIPVGIAVARQRLQHQETSSSMRNVSLSHHTSHHASYHHFQPESLGPATAMTVGGATLLHCGTGGDDRPAHLAIPSNALPPSLNAALNSSLNSTLGNIGTTAATAWPPTLWQYPTAAMPMEPVGFPQMGVGLQGGLQLVRDPTTGHLLLIHAAEQMQQAVVWPNYPSHNGSNVGPPPFLLPPPPPSLQLLSDIGGARLVLTENKRKQQNSLPIVKIEADCGNSPTTIITSTESTKALQTVTTMTGTLVPDTPLVTTLHYYPHAPALVQISQAEPTHCRSQRNAFLSKATSPVSCLTPPPEVTTIHAIEPPESTPIGVQDASNQTDAPEIDEELPVVEPIIKQEQNLSPCQQLQSTNVTNYEIVSSPERLCNIVRVTNVNSNSVGNIVGRVDKGENTMINMQADYPKYTVSPIKDCRNIVTSVDRTIEHVVKCHAESEEEEEEEAEKEMEEEVEEDRIPEMRTGAKIIEITEENCDSFHENLEFFGSRRREPLEHYRKLDDVGRRCEDRRQKEVEVKVTENVRTPEIYPLGGRVPVTNAEAPQRESEVVSDSAANIVPKSRVETPDPQGRADCENCSNNNREIWNQNIEGHPQLTVKSFDMPSIDCDDQVEPVVVKQEKDDSRFAECIYSQKSQVPVDKPKCQERAASELPKRHSGEKFHPGIENVVEKLKKNAAAALQDVQKIEETSESRAERSVSQPRKVDGSPRRLENGLKKLILRSCKNAEIAEKRASGDRCSGDEREDGQQEHLLLSGTKYVQCLEKNGLSSDKNLSVRGCTVNNSSINGNISSSGDVGNGNNNNNNNGEEINRVPKQEKIVESGMFETEEPKLEVESTILKKDHVSKVASSVPTSRSPLAIVDSRQSVVDNASSRSKTTVGSKQKPTVDVSGLELLSNSIEQFEHLMPGTQNGSNFELEKSPDKLKQLTQQQGESNNNNVDSPLGLLCALAEQRFMEEIGDNVSKRASIFESSEEISHAGRLLLNLGRKGVLEKEWKRLDKRKHSIDDRGSAKRLRENNFRDGSNLHHYEMVGKSRRYESRNNEEDLIFRVKERTRRSIDFSARNGTGVEVDRDLEAMNPEARNKCPYYEDRLTGPQDLSVKSVGSYEKNGFFEEYDYIRTSNGHYDGVPGEDDFTDSESENRAIVDGNKLRTRQQAMKEENELNDLRSSTSEGSQEFHESHHKYRSLQAKLEAKKFIARKGHVENDNEWPNMDAMELDMRVRLADIQRQYKEKQKELSRLTPKKDDKKSPGRPRKKSHSFSSDGGAFPSPAALEPVNLPQKSPTRSTEGAPPPLTSAVLAMPRCNVNLVKLGEPRSHIKLLDSIPSIPISVPTVVSPITVLPASKILQEDDDKNTSRLGYETSSPAPTIASSSSASKKRKVGRPRKLMCASGSVRHLTETIVAKKPKGKGSLVGYLSSAKNRHLQNKFISKTGYTPLPFKPGLTSVKSVSKNHKITKQKIKPVKQTPLHNKNVISSIIAKKAKLSQEAKLEKQVSKVKPKLKAEAKIKTWEDEECGVWNGAVVNAPSEVTTIEVPKAAPVEPTEKHERIEREKERHEKSKKKKRKSCSSSPKRRKSGERDTKESKRRKSSECKECKECARAVKAERVESIASRCKLTAAHLAIDQLRVLTAMGGLFYAGRLSAVQAPDVYAITLDGERGNRPHIHSREEILRDAIVEVCPSSTKELPPGSRLCAYWSQQYRCLYPGTSVEPTEPDPELDEKFVSVEFDDGDSGRIALDDIRLLQPDYPVVEYDPNPLLTLGKRRRQTSTSTDDKRSSATGNQSSAINSSAVTSTTTSSTTTNATSTSETKLTEQQQQKSDDVDAKVLDEYRERKRLKKRRRDKLKRLQEAQEGKKRHKKHRCCDEHRKHKHRKHRKHKHKHSHHSSHSEGSHLSGGESCSGQKSEEEPIKESSPKIDEQEEDEEEEEEEDEEEEEEEEEEKSGRNKSEKLIEEPVVEKRRGEKVEKVEKSKKSEKKTKSRERQESVESRSKMAAFLPARQLWGWAGKGYRRPGAKGRAKKQFFRAIQRGSETIQIGDSAVFLSTGRPDRPYIGRIESMWETSSSNMIVKVKWFYHPEETVGCPTNLKYPGALFESPHMDENDVQTISHKCEVLPLQQYTEKLGKEPHRYLTIYDNNDIYYLAGYYDPTTYLLTMQPGVV